MVLGLLAGAARHLEEQFVAANGTFDRQRRENTHQDAMERVAPVVAPALRPIIIMDAAPAQGIMIDMDEIVFMPAAIGRIERGGQEIGNIGQPGTDTDRLPIERRHRRGATADIEHDVVETKIAMDDGARGRTILAHGDDRCRQSFDKREMARREQAIIAIPEQPDDPWQRRIDQGVEPRRADRQPIEAVERGVAPARGGAWSAAACAMAVAASASEQPAS